MGNDYNWKPCSGAISNAGLEELRLILSEAHERVKVSTDDAELLYKRSVNLLTVVIAIMTTAIGYLGTKITILKQGAFTPIELVLYINIAVVSILLWVICSKLKKNIVTDFYNGVGTRPSKLFVEEFLINPERKKGSEWELLYNLILSYEKRFETNRQCNTTRADNYDISIKLFYWIPFVTLIIWVCAVLFRLI